MCGNFGARYGYNKPSESIQKILSDKNKTLEDLLREEDLLHELNSKNEELFKYFDKEKIKKLIDYIIKEPEIDENAPETQENKDKGYKFPFVCYQIFGLELEELLKYFFMTNKQIEKELKNENKENVENKKEDNNKEVEKKENESNENNNNKDKSKKEESENNNEDKDKKDLKNKQNELIDNKEDKKDIEKQKKDEIKDNEKEKNKEEKEIIEEKKIVKKENKDEEKEKIEENKDIDDNKDVKNKEDSNEKKVEKNQSEKKENIEENKEHNKEENKEENKEKNKEEKKEENKEKNKEENKEENKSLENRIELIDYLFTFLSKDYKEGNKLNYVLCGYFSSLITNLLNVNPTVFLKYIYKERKDIFKLMTSHFYRKSISNALSKILYFENYFSEDTVELDEETKKDMNNTRDEVLLDIFSSININMDNERLNSIYFFITELFETSTINETKEIFKNMIDNKNIIKALIYKPLANLDLTINFNENRRENFIIIIDIIIFFLINIKKAKLDIPTCTSSDSKSSIKHTAISSELFIILPKLIKNNFNKKNHIEKKILQSFDECQLSPLGEFKIKIVDLIYHLIPYFKKVSKFFDDILIKSEFFKHGFDFLFQYEWNNLYQETFLSLLKTLLDYSEYHDLIFNYLFNQLKIIEIIKSHSHKENKFKFINKGKDSEGKDISKDISRGYISFLVSLCYKINTVIGGDPLGVNANPSTEGSFEFIPKVNEDNDNNDFFCNIDDKNENSDKKENKEEDEIKKGVPIESMKKYLNDDWALFFNENISNIIKQYCDKNWPPKEKDMEIFDFLFQEEKKEENKEEIKEENKEGKKEENKEENNGKKNETLKAEKKLEENKLEENKAGKVESENSNGENNNENIDNIENKENNNKKEQTRKEEHIDNDNAKENIKEEDKREMKEEKKEDKRNNEDNKNEKKELDLEKKQNEEKEKENNNNNKDQNDKNENIEKKQK